MIWRRIIRIALRVLAVIGVIVAALVLAVIVLRLTNPSPSGSFGWVRASDMPEKRGEVASAAVGREVVIAGGLSGFGTTSDEVTVFNLDTDAWRGVQALPAPRHHAAASAHGEYVYVSGGAQTATDWTPQTNLWRGRPGQGWKAMAPMPEGRQGHTMVTHEDKLYVIGGGGPTDDVLIYDVEDDAWSTASALPAGRDHLLAEVWNDRIWVLAGRSDKVRARVDVYDPATDGWIRGPSLPDAMSAMAVGVLNNNLHVFGGEHPGFFGGKVSNRHYYLEPGARAWQRGPNQLLGVHGAGYASDGRRIVIVGGASRHGAFSTVSWTNVTQIYVSRLREESQR